LETHTAQGSSIVLPCVRSMSKQLLESQPFQIVAQMFMKSSLLGKLKRCQKNWG